MSDCIKASLGRRIKTLRRENGLTQAKLALMINVEQSYLSKLELGSRNPSLSMLSKIADAFGITLSELFSGLPKTRENPRAANESNSQAETQVLTCQAEIARSMPRESQVARTLRRQRNNALLDKKGRFRGVPPHQETSRVHLSRLRASKRPSIGRFHTPIPP